MTITDTSGNPMLQYQRLPGDPTLTGVGYGQIADGFGRLTKISDGPLITMGAGFSSTESAGSGCQADTGPRHGYRGGTPTTTTMWAGRRFRPNPRLASISEFIPGATITMTSDRQPLRLSGSVTLVTHRTGTPMYRSNRPLVFSIEPPTSRILHTTITW